MSKIKSIDELKEFSAALKNKVDILSNGEAGNKIVLAVGMATCGIAAGAKEVMDKLNEEIKAHSLNNVAVVPTGCLGYCYAEPIVEVRMPGQESILYGNVDVVRAKQIIDDHIVSGKFLDNAIIGRGL